MVPEQDPSGNTDKLPDMTRKGNKPGRRLLVQAAHYIMGPFSPDCDLRSYGIRTQSRGGGMAKKKSFVAVARKRVAVIPGLPKKKHPFCLQQVPRH